jgi:CheY-like chemotaxis protein
MRGVSIFLVEDETLIRMMVVEMLKELGHRVVAEAGSIQTAEPLARTSEFDLAVFDINVAGFIISPIAEIVAARGLPFVFISGYGPEGLPALFKDKPVVAQAISDFTVCGHDQFGSERRAQPGPRMNGLLTLSPGGVPGGVV